MHITIGGNRVLLKLSKKEKKKILANNKKSYYRNLVKDQQYQSSLQICRQYVHRRA